MATSPEQPEQPSYLGIASVVLAYLSPALFFVCAFGAANDPFGSTAGNFFRHMTSGSLSFLTSLFWLGIVLSPIMLLLAWILGITGLIRRGQDKTAALAGTFISTVEWIICAPIAIAFVLIE